jgi:subtilisin family serine protease
MSIQFFSAVNALLENACAYAYDSGTLPVAASGNNGTLQVAWPARYSKCMAVGATTNTDARASFSNYGPEMDVVAPGVGIYNIWRFSGYSTQSGTSMATPHVSGIAALIMSHNPALTVPEVEAIIRNTADDKGPAGWDQEYGTGRVNLNAALIAAAPDCIGDTNGSGAVDVADLLAVITSWGACPAPPAACPADVSPSGPPAGDGLVNVADLLQVISHWGACP